MSENDNNKQNCGPTTRDKKRKMSDLDSYEKTINQLQLNVETKKQRPRSNSFNKQSNSKSHNKEIESDNEINSKSSESFNSEDDLNSKSDNEKSDSEDEFLDKCDIYGLPYVWSEYSSINSVDFKTKKKLNQKYSDFKKQLMNKQIDLKTILSLSNILDSERNQLIEKYALMNNSNQDLITYVKIRDEIWDMIKYYQNTDKNIRKINMEKKQKLDAIIVNTSELENKILSLFSNISDPSLNTTNNNYLYIQGLIYQKYKKLTNLSPGDSEYYKLKEWIDTAVKIPYNSSNTEVFGSNISNKNLSQTLTEIKKGLDKELYGMVRVKEELLMAINQRLTNPSKSDTSIALVGPPGVGKTRIISVLANLLNYPYEHISMGGVNDSSFLAGHSYTYEGAKPGKIVDSLIKMNCANGIMFFDEIDKIADTSNGKEVSSQLLHITDFTQNDHFCDKYLPEIPIDLSKIWFIFSLNNISSIDPILANRFNFIYVDGYNFEQKMEIAKQHLLPKAYDKYKLSSEKYPLNDQIIEKIIRHSIFKEQKDTSITIDSGISGIRELKRSIDHIFNRISLLENMSSINKSESNINIIHNLSFYPEGIDIKQLNKIKITESLIDKFLSTI
jgi:ATP-dependent Lon protease